MDIAVLGIRGLPNIQGGVEKHSEELYFRLASSECNITVFVRSPYFDKNKHFDEWEKIELVYLWCPKCRHFETIVHTLFGIIESILKRPDIIHFHNMGPALCIPLVKLFGIKSVFTYHSVNYEHAKWGRSARLLLKLGEFLGIRFADKIIVVSQTIKKFLEKKYRKTDLIFIPNGVTLPDLLSPGSTLKKHKLEPQEYIFTTCRFVPEKGVHDLIAAYKKIKNPQFKLVISGDADHKTNYHKRIIQETKGVEGIILTGFITGRPLQELYSNAGLFVLPSYHEGLSLCLLEAMSYGLTLLVSDIPANREIPLAEANYFPVGDVDALSEKIVELFVKKVPEEERRRNKQILLKNYNWQIIAQKTCAVYSQVLGS